MSRERRPRTSKISRTSGLAEGCGSSSCSEQDDVPLAVQVLGAWEPVLVRGSRDQKTSAIAAHQRGRVKRAQLLSVGVSDNMIESMMRSGLLIPRMPGVYAVGHAAPTELARETEALLSSSLPAVLCQLSATGLWGLGRPPRLDAPVDILIHGDTTVRHAGVRSHRTKHLDPKDVRIHRGLPVTSPARTLVDVTPLVSDDELEHMLDEALEHKLVRITQIRDVIARYGAGRPGAHRGEAKLIVEVDSWAHHRQRNRFEGDRTRDTTLATHGWLTLRFTARRIRNEPYAVIAEIALMLGRRLEAAQRAA